MKVFDPLKTLYRSFCSALSNFFVDEYECMDDETVLGVQPGKTYTIGDLEEKEFIITTAGGHSVCVKKCTHGDDGATFEATVVAKKSAKKKAPAAKKSSAKKSVKKKSTAKKSAEKTTRRKSPRAR